MKKVDTVFLIVILGELIMTGYWYLMISTIPPIKANGLMGGYAVAYIMSDMAAVGIAVLAFWWLLGILITTVVVYVAIHLSMWLKSK